MWEEVSEIGPPRAYVSTHPEYQDIAPSKTRHSEVVYIAKAFAQQAELDQAVDRVKQMLGSDVVRLRYALGQDWSGESAIFFGSSGESVGNWRAQRRG